MVRTAVIVPLLLAQAVAGPVLPRTPRLRSDAPCPSGGDLGEIVVCARDNEAYRLRPPPPRSDQPALPKARIAVGDARLAAEAEQGTLAGGAQSQRLMVRLNLPFGAKKRAEP